MSTKTGTAVCSGILAKTREGMTIRVSGEETRNKKGLSIKNAIVEDVFDRQSAIDYLTSIQGIGKLTAEKAVNAFGEQIFNMQNPSSVDDFCTVGIPRQKAETIVKSLHEEQAFRELFEYLLNCGAKYASAAEMFADLGSEALATLKEQPYLIGHKYGLSFVACELIAQDIGMEASDARRINGAAFLLLEAESKAGHAYREYAYAVARITAMLNRSRQFPKVSTVAVANAIYRNEHIITMGNRVYLDYIYWQERKLAGAIRRLQSARQALPLIEPRQIESIEKMLGVHYDDAQRNAFKLLSAGGIGIITGGPGTGKTTVLNGLLHVYQQLCPEKTVMLCAPTGRAAQRMRETTGREAQTIHSLLGIVPYSTGLLHKNENDPINVDLLVIDEASMLNLEIAEMLFSAIPCGAQVLILGDSNQLPAIGAGNVLADLLKCSRLIPSVRLRKIFRQKDGGELLGNIERIRSGDACLVEGKDFEIIKVDSDDQIPDIIEQEFKKYWRADDPFALQVLVPARRKTSSGANAINIRLQELMPEIGDRALTYGATRFRKGDKVMFMRNNVQHGYFNGDVGIVSSVEDSCLSVRLYDGTEVQVSGSRLEDVSLAFATTIHKAQGAEYETVLIGLPNEPRILLSLNSLFTAVSRSKKKVVLIAANGATEIACENRQVERRNSGLIDALKEG